MQTWTQQQEDSTDIEQRYVTQAAINEVVSQFSSGQVFYASTDAKFFILSVDGANVKSIAETTEYIKRTVRSNLLFQYTHNSPNNRRIDPSPNNIIDLYLLTKNYSDDYVRWVTDATGQDRKSVV